MTRIADKLRIAGVTATFALVHGAWGTGRSWDAVRAELEARGHRVVAPDLPCEDVEAGVEEYAAAVAEALGGTDDAVVVGHSLGGLTIPLVPARKLVFVAAYVPRPGHTLLDRGEAAFAPGFAASVVQDELRRSYWPDLAAAVHDLQFEVAEDEALAAAGALRRQARKPIVSPWPGGALPDVARAYVVCARDAVVPPDFQRRLARDELGVAPLELDGGHSPALVRPRELAALLDALAG
jgi:pimeloyl-ACP methyl ester carboxylesterase